MISSASPGVQAVRQDGAQERLVFEVGVARRLGHGGDAPANVEIFKIHAVQRFRFGTHHSRTTAASSLYLL